MNEGRLLRGLETDSTGLLVRDFFFVAGLNQKIGTSR